jgi:hypothetical protein
MWSSKYSTLVHPAAAETIDTPAHSCLDTLHRLRGGWRPSQRLLAAARHAERWSVARSAEATAYQFVGSASQLPAGTSLMIATVLALDPKEGWAFLFSDRWVTLGDPLPQMHPFDPADVERCAAAWLRAQAH